MAEKIYQPGENYQYPLIIKKLLHTLALKSRGDYRILVTPDHPTPLRTKTHSHGFVPFAIAGAGIRPDAASTYDDPTGNRSELVFEEGWKLMPYFVGS